MGIKEDLEKILSELNNVNDITGYALVRDDGLPLITNLKNEIDLNNMCSSCASINQNTKSNFTNFDNVIIEYSEGNNVIVKKIGDETLLFSITSKNANLSNVIQKMKSISKQLEEIL